MKNRDTLTVTSLISTSLFALHWVDEISRGLEPGTISSIGGVAILVVLLCGPLVLRERLPGSIIMLLGGIVGVGVLVLHMRGHGMVGGRIANTGGIFFWVLTLISLGATSAVTAILAAMELWNTRRSRSP